MLALLAATASVINVAHLPGAVSDPPADLVLCDVAREDASQVVAELRRLGCGEEGAIVLQPIEGIVSVRAERAVEVAAGSSADAIVWEQVEAQTSESADFSISYLAFMTLATLIAAAGILTDSVVLIIGAMVVGPEFGPLAGVAVATVERRPTLALRSLTALAIGFPVAIAITGAGTLLVRQLGLGPGELSAIAHPATLFISDPNAFSVIVAVLAGIAGTLSLTTAKAGALIGVLISVTTVPAAANVGVAAAYGDWGELSGALAQLSINLVALLVASTLTLAAQRWAYGARRLLSVREEKP